MQPELLELQSSQEEHLLSGIPPLPRKKNNYHRLIEPDTNIQGQFSLFATITPR